MHTLHITLAFVEAGTSKEWTAPSLTLDDDTIMALPLILAEYNAALPPGPKVYQVEMRQDDRPTGTIRITHTPGLAPSSSLVHDGTDPVGSAFMQQFNTNFADGLTRALSALQVTRDARRR